LFFDTIYSHLDAIFKYYPWPARVPEERLNLPRHEIQFYQKELPVDIFIHRLFPSKNKTTTLDNTIELLCTPVSFLNYQKSRAHPAKGCLFTTLPRKVRKNSCTLAFWFWFVQSYVMGLSSIQALMILGLLYWSLWTH